VIADRLFDDAQRQHLLADAAGAIAWAPDAQVALRRVAELAVPRLADWCTVDVLEGEATYRRLAVVHAESRWHGHVGALLGPWTPDPRRRGVAHVVRTGEREVAADVADVTALVPTDDVDRERLVAQLGVAAYVSVPLIAHARPLGALTLVAADPRRRFEAGDVALVETLARMAALAVANARLDRELIDVSRRQDVLLAALSHQLRTPLTAMLAWLELTRHGGDTAATARALDTIERNGRILARLIDELMDTARILIGKAYIVRRPVDLAVIVERAVSAQLGAARDKGVCVDTALDPAAGAYVGDGERLEQVVAMLLANAVKFTPSGGRVVIHLDGDVARARIRVSDSGRGISGEVLPHVFELFRRGSDAPADAGLGLGLAIVRGLVALHGGTVEAASDGEDRGATFTVILPRET
jgi:signal transduction histidine kinase